MSRPSALARGAFDMTVQPLWTLYRDLFSATLRRRPEVPARGSHRAHTQARQLVAGDQYRRVGSFCSAPEWA